MVEKEHGMMFVLSSPSGAGKTTLTKKLAANNKNFSISITPDQVQNLIDDWSAPKPIDAFYKRVFGMTYAEKKAQEDAEYFYYDENGKKKEVRKSKEETQSVH